MAKIRKCATLFALMAAFMAFMCAQCVSFAAADAYAFEAGIASDENELANLVPNEGDDEFPPALLSAASRLRPPTPFYSLLIFKTALLGFSPCNPSFAERLSALNLWNRLVGYEFAAAPHTDMVARK